MHGPAPPDSRVPLQSGFAAGAEKHGRFDLASAVFQAAVRRLWSRGRAQLDLPATDAAFAAGVERLHLDDLCPAQAWEAGDENAWRRLRNLYQADLTGALRRDGRFGADAEAYASSVTGDMALPAPEGRAATRLGTYEGTGPLWPWPTVIGIRRARKQINRQPEALDARVEAPSEPGPDPILAVVAREEAAAFERGLWAAWESLEPRERSASILKHGDGLTQRAAAGLLGVSEPTVSRLVAAALVNVRGAVTQAVDLHCGERWAWRCGRVWPRRSHDFLNDPAVP